MLQYKEWERQEIREKKIRKIIWYELLKYIYKIYISNEKTCTHIHKKKNIHIQITIVKKKQDYNNIDNTICNNPDQRKTIEEQNKIILLIYIIYIIYLLYNDSRETHA